MATSIEILNLAQLSFWNNKPTATLYQTSVWATPNNVSPYNTCPFQASTEDNWSGHSNVTNNTRYTIPVAGTYRISGLITWSSNSTGIRVADIQKNGTRVSSVNPYTSANSGTFTSVQIPAVNVVCVVGDYLEMGGYQNSGSSLNTVASNTYLSVEFLHF